MLENGRWGATQPAEKERRRGVAQLQLLPRWEGRGRKLRRSAKLVERSNLSTDDKWLAFGERRSSADSDGNISAEKME